MEKSLKKFIIITRHGERIDLTKDRGSQKLEKDDPELSPEGRHQAEKAGKKIFEYLKSHHNFTISSSNTILVTSPFSRTIQTSLGLTKSYGIQSDSIKLENKICELIMPHSVSHHIPSEYVAVFTPVKESNSSYKNNFELYEKSNFSFANYNQLNFDHLPIVFETTREAFNRVEGSYLDNIKLYFENDNKNIIHFVSHAATLNFFYAFLMMKVYKNEPNKAKEFEENIETAEYNIRYCDTFIFEIKENEKGEKEYFLDTKISIHD